MTKYTEKVMKNMENAARAMKELGLSLEKAGYGKPPEGFGKYDESIETLDPSIKSLIKNGVYGKLPSKYNEDLKEYWMNAATGKVGANEPDTRYNVPKEAPKVSDEKVEETIEATEIYRRAKELILKAQHKQVGYGLDKYPEPLNADTWSMIETIDHIIDESIDKLHYLVMLRVKLEQDAKKEIETFREDSLDTHKYSISAMEKLYTEDPLSQNVTPIYIDSGQVGYVDANGKTVWSCEPLTLKGKDMTAKEEARVCEQEFNSDSSDIEHYCKADAEATQEFYESIHKPFEELTPDDYAHLRKTPKLETVNSVRKKLGYRGIKATTVVDDEIVIGNERIKALEDGRVTIDGEEISSFYQMQKAMNILTRSLIKVAGGNPTIHTEDKKGDK